MALPLVCYHYTITAIRSILKFLIKTREPTPVSPLTSYIIHLTSRRLPLQFPARSIVVTAARARLGVVIVGHGVLVGLSLGGP